MSRDVLINGKWPIVLPESSADEWTGNMEHHEGGWEVPRLNKLEELIRTHNDGNGHYAAPVVMYIGAYKGDMPALLATWGAKLILMESTPAFWTLIQEAWELNSLPDPVGFWSGLVSNRSIMAESTMPPLDKWPTRKAEYIEGHVGFTHLAESGEDIVNFPQITIDYFVQQSKIIPDIITMDVEGSELLVLQGGINTLKNHNAKYMMSLHPEFGFHNHGYYMREVFDLFEHNGYKWEFIDFDHEFHFLFEKSST